MRKIRGPTTSLTVRHVVVAAAIAAVIAVGAWWLLGQPMGSGETWEHENVTSGMRATANFVLASPRREYKIVETHERWEHVTTDTGAPTTERGAAYACWKNTGHRWGQNLVGMHMIDAWTAFHWCGIWDDLYPHMKSMHFDPWCDVASVTGWQCHGVTEVVRGKGWSDAYHAHYLYRRVYQRFSRDVKILGLGIFHEDKKIWIACTMRSDGTYSCDSGMM